MNPAEVIEDILAHVGVKGMKWGVRREHNSNGGTSSGSTKVSSSTGLSVATRKERRAAKRIAKADKRFEKIGTSKGKQYELKRQVHNTVAPIVQSKVHQMNAKPEYAKAIAEGRFKNPNDPVAKKYVKEYNKMYIDTMNDYLKGYTNPSGTKVVKAHLNSESFNGFELRIENASRIKHANDFLTIKINYIKDDKGRIVDVELIKDDLIQSEEFVDNFLAHVGVKGMKWGVRRKATVGPQEVIVRDSRVPGSKRLVTKGGGGHPAVPEAVRARKIGQISKKSGLKALSDQELQEYARRLQLEQNVKRLRFEDKNPGQKFVATVLGQSGRSTAKEATNEGIKRSGKKALKLAGLAAA